MALTQVSTDGIKNGTITGTDLATNIDLVDNQEIRFGTGSDLKIYHNGSGSYIDDSSGTGELILKSNSISFTNAAENEYLARFFQDSAVQLFFNSSKKFETVTNGISIGGRIEFTDTNSIITRPTGSALSIETGGTERLRVNSSGNVKLPDNGKLQFGGALNSGDGDLEIYHNGSNSYIDNGTGNLYFRGSNGQMLFRPNNSEDALVLKPNGAVELYHDNSKKLETASNGGTLTGDWSVTNDFFWFDNGEAVFGTGGDFKIYHNGSDSLISNSTGVFFIQNAGDLRLRVNNTEAAVHCVANGAVELYHNSNKKLETTSQGIEVTSNGTVVANTVKSTGSARADMRILAEGTGEAYLWLDASNGDLSGADYAFIQHKNSTLDLFIGNYASDVIIKTRNGSLGSGGLNTSIHCHENGAVDLYHDSTKRLETTSGGIVVNGDIGSDGIYMGDNERAKFGSSDDLQLYHDGTDSYILENGAGVLNIKTNGTAIDFTKTPHENLARFIVDGACELYHDNSLRIKTQSYGNEFYNQQHKFIHSNSGGVGAYLSLFNTSNTHGSSTGISFGIGTSNAQLDGTDYGEGQIKVFTDSGAFGNMEFNLHVNANRSWMKIVGNGQGLTGASSGTEGFRGGVAFGNAGIALDRSWTGQPGIHVFNANSEGDTDQGTFRFHGFNRSYASYPAASGSDFSVNLVADGSGLSSDKRRKTGIANIANALDTITKMRGVSFQFVNRELEPQTHMSMDNGKKLGFIAQEVIPLLPQLILDSGEKNAPLENGWCDRYSMDYSGMTAVLVEAIKELAAKVAVLESKT